MREWLGTTRSLRTEDTHPLPITHYPLPAVLSARLPAPEAMRQPQNAIPSAFHRLSQKRTVELTHGSQEVWSRVRWTSAAGVQAVNGDITGFGVGSAGVCVLSAFVDIDWNRNR